MNTKYLLIQSVPYEGPSIRSFASDKSVEQLQSEFKQLWDDTNERSLSKFCDVTFYRGSDDDFDDWEIVTLDEFWKENLPSRR